MKETMEKKATERAEVVQQARKLLLQKKPMCRRINRSFFVSEVFSHGISVYVISKSVLSIKFKIIQPWSHQCLRELDAQVAFQKTIREMDKEQDAKYANMIKTNVAKYEKQKKQEAEERAKKMRNYKMELKKQ
jgi:hypothetical protein